MNLRWLQYAYVLSQYLSISQAAEKLKISQPALSKQILNLEKELGVTLFDRSCHPIKITPAGESFLTYAERIVHSETQLRRVAAEYSSGEKGNLVIGISPFRAKYFITDAISTLHKKYPGLKIVLRDVKSAQLRKELFEGNLDFAILNLPVDELLFDVVRLDEERIVLALKKELVPPGLCESPYNGELLSATLNDFESVPFIALTKEQELRRQLDKLCFLSDAKLEIKTEVFGITTAWSLAQAGIGATVLPSTLVESSRLNDDMAVYTLINSESVRTPAIVLRKGQFVSVYAKEAIELIKNR